MPVRSCSPKVSRSLLLISALALAPLGCTTKTGTEGKIVVTINLGTNFNTDAITGLVLMLDAPGDAGLNLNAQAAQQQSKGGHTYTSEVKDCDADGRNEFCVTFAVNPFSAGTYSFTFSGAWTESVLLSLRVIVQLDNGAKQESATKEQFDDATNLRFVWGQSKTVTASIPCRVGYSCASQTATTLTLTGTDPASPSNSATPKVKGTADSAWTVKIYDNATCTGTALGTGTGAAFAGAGIEVTVTENATTTLYAQATDTSSNTSSCVGPLSYTHDGVLPTTPGSLASTPSSPANYNTPAIKGTADVGTTVRVFNVAACDAGSYVASGTAETFAGAGIALTVIDNTTTTFSANSADTAGNVSGCSSNVTFVEDSTPPAVPVGTGVTPQGPANNNAPIVAGTGEADTTIRIYAGDPACTSTPTTGTVSDAGLFAVAVTVQDNTTTVFNGRVVDLAGNVGLCTSLNAAIPYIEDSTAPAAPGAPDLAAGSDMGALNWDNTTNDSTPTFTGSVEGFAMVSLYHDGGVLVGTASTDGDGGYSVTSSTLTDGIYAFTVRAQDDAGNVSDASVSLTVTIDTTPPSTPASAPDLVAGSDTASTTDNITRATTPTFSGTVEMDAAVYLYKDGVQVGTATADGTGAYSVTSSALTDGTYAFTVEQVDVAGNGSDASVSLAVKIDTTIAMPPAPHLDAGTDTGFSSTDNITRNTTPMLHGTLEADAGIVIYQGGTPVGSTTADPMGAYMFVSSALTDGTYTFTVQATDPAGNVSDASAGLTVTIDSTIATPAAPVLDPASDTGQSQSDRITRNTTPSFTGTVEANATVSLYHSDAGTTVVGTAAANNDGGYSVTSAPLTTDGPYTFVIKATDPAGNASDASTGLVITIDTTPPSAPGAPDLVASSDTGASNSDNITGDTTPTLDGGGATAGAMVRLFNGTSALIATTTAAGDGTYVITTPTLAEGDYLFTAREVDTAGNESADSSPLAVTIDSLVDCPPAGAIARFEPDGPIYAMARAGCTTYVGGNFTTMFARTGGGAPLNNSNGGLAIGAPRKINGSVYAVAPDDAGGWYIGGDFTSVGGVARSRLARLNADGTLHGWNPGGANDTVRALAVSGGAVYAGGDFTAINDTQISKHLAAIDTNGALLPWNPSADASVYALAVNDGKVFAGGRFETIGAETRNRLAAIDFDGGLLAWNPDSDDEVYALAVSDGRVYAGGRFDKVSGTTRKCLAAIDTDGGLLTFDVGNVSCADAGIYALAATGGAVYAGGVFQVDPSMQNLVAFNADGGTLPLILGLDWNNAVYALAVDGGTVYAGGAFTTIGGVARNRVAAISTDGGVFAWNPNADSVVRALAVSGSQVYAGGEFMAIGQTPRSGLAAIDLDAGLLPWGPISNGPVYALAVSGGTIYAGGDFTAIDGGTRNRLAAIGADGTPLPWNPNANAQVNVLSASGTQVYAGGAFLTMGGQTRNYLAAIGTDGTLLPWSPNPNGFVYSLAESGGALFTGGYFTTIGDQTRNSLAAFSTNDGGLLPWNPNAGDIVNALTVSGSTVYVGGGFVSIGGEGRTYLAAIDVDGGLLPWNPNLNYFPTRGIAVSGGVIYVAGSFGSVGGNTRMGLAAFRADGGQLLPWNSNVSGGAVFSLIASTVTIYAGGSFTTIDGGSAPYLVPLNAITGLLE